ncbi:hypothetical protein [Streptomyces sp. AC555_RSS877]|uniref:hypothetical protein n=1 Tax=Streptomyces sp. AC555_RSS877 TaxID=2823688 RepID=UPI001C27126E|nr:hypothetical protein [Streptomyces sp. AC555_RSS877]
MEKPLVVPLFERTSRSVGLTAAGQALLPEARAVLAATYQLRRTAGAQRRQLSGRLAARTMGAEAAMPHTRAVLHALQDRHPHIGVPLLRVFHRGGHPLPDRGGDRAT